jgi:chorismate mutase
MPSYARTVDQVDRELARVVERREQARREIKARSQTVIDCTAAITRLLDERVSVLMPVIPDTPEGIPG